MKTVASTLYPFVPSGPRYKSSIDFFAELGFVKEWENGGYAGFRFGGAYFMLQDIDVPIWQTNQMVVFEVDDLDLYWTEIADRDLPIKYPGAKLKPPTDFEWGREIHIVDPGGVCWHVRQAAVKT